MEKLSLVKTEGVKQKWLTTQEAVARWGKEELWSRVHAGTILARRCPRTKGFGNSKASSRSARQKSKKSRRHRWAALERWTSTLPWSTRTWTGEACMRMVTILSSTAVGGNTIGPTLELAAASSPAGSGSAPGTGEWGEPLCLDAGWAPPHGSPRCHDHLASSWPIPPDTSRWVVQEKEIPASAGAWLWSWQLLWEREDVSDVGHRLVEAGSPWAWGPSTCGTLACSMPPQTRSR